MADKNIPIIPLKESDIISQSVNTINQNFKTIVNNYDISNFKWEQYSKKITDEIEKLKRHCDKSNIDITRSVDSLNTRIDNITDLNDIQTQINNAIMNANLELTGFISDLAGQQVANAMGGYVKTSALDSKLKGYVASSAFETYKSDAKNRTASSSLIVANSKFATVKYNEKDYLINIDGSRSQYQTIEEYWKTVKDTYPDLSDKDILKKFIEKCEKTFRTVSTELANISAKVGPGSAQVDIIAAVEGENGEQIVGAIITKANKSGSLVGLNADKIHLDAKHKLTLNSGTFEINSSNLTLNDDGLVLSGRGGKTKIDANGILHAQGADIQGTITADRFESEKTDNYTVSVGENDYSGAITKKTLMNSNEFCIESIGKLSPNNGIGSDIDVTGNKLYIKIMDKLPNANTDIKDASGQTADYLYGVPVLCMMYNNVEYPLSPASWFMPSSGENPTDMYFTAGGGDNNTYSSVSSKKPGFYRSSQKNVNLNLRGCKKYVFAYSNPGNESSYKDILLTAGLINNSNVGVTTYDVTPTGLIKTTQSVGKIPITEGENLKKFKANIKPSCDIYQRFMDSDKTYFGDFSSLPYYIYDAGDTTTPVDIITRPSWFNSNIFNYIKDNLNTGNWSYGEGIDPSQQSEPEVYFNPFKVNITGGICGSIRYNIVGYYKQSYVNGFQTNTSSVNGFADCEYVATIYFNDSSKITFSAMVNGVSKTFYATNMNVRVSFGVYKDNTTESELMNLLKSGDINNIDTDVHIEAEIDLSSYAGVIGYDGISLVYRNNS